jgi:ribose transport system substrate-binding protein
MQTMSTLRYSTALFSLILFAVLSGCRKQSSTVAVIPRTTATLLWEPMHLGAAETARKVGLHIYWNAPADDGDVEKQLSDFTSCVKRGYGGIVFAPDETLASRSIVLDAVSRKIPVVVVDDELGPPAGPWLSYVSNDEAKGARMAVERLATILHGHGSIAIIGMNTRSANGVAREEGFERDLAQIAPAIQISSRAFGDTIVTHQQQIAQHILDSKKVSAIIAMTGTATRGAYYARLAAGPRADVSIIGFDQDSLIPIQSEEVDSVVVQDTRRIGQIAIENLDAQMRGEKVQPVTLVPPILLTRQTVSAPEITRLWQFSQFAWDQQ